MNLHKSIEETLFATNESIENEIFLNSLIKYGIKFKDYMSDYPIFEIIDKSVFEVYKDFFIKKYFLSNFIMIKEIKKSNLENFTK